MTSAELRAALKDSNWLFVLPAPTDSKNPAEVLGHATVNSWLIAELNKEGTRTCHAALIDANGDIHPGFFVWDPDEAFMRRTDEVDQVALIRMTPQYFKTKGKPDLIPDLESLEIGMGASKIVASDGLSATVQQQIVGEMKRNLPSFLKNNILINCFFLIPRPFPSYEVAIEKVEKLCNIRNLDFEESMRALAKEVKVKTFTARTQRFRELILNVIISACPEFGVFGLKFTNKEGVHV